MAYALDGAILVLFLVMVALGVRHGFIKTIAGVVAFVAALVLSSLLAGPVSGFAYDTFVEPPVQEALMEEFGRSTPAAEQLDTVLEKLPAFVTNRLEAEGLGDGAAILERIRDGEEDTAAYQRILTGVVEPVVLPLMKALCMLLLFILLWIVITLVLRALDVVAKLPVLKQLNGLLGVAAGAVQGLLWVLFAVAALRLVADMGWIDALTPAVLEDTVLVRYLDGWMA